MTLEEKQPTRFRSGLTKSSCLAAIYATVIFIPALMYLELMTGLSGFPVAWFTLLLWVKLSELTGRKLTKQEAFLVFTLAGIEFLPLYYVQRTWYRTSGIAEFFGLTQEFPNWWVPPLGSGAFEVVGGGVRGTLFHPDWVLPITVTLTWLVISIFLSISLGYFARELFVEEERLPFPIEQMNAVSIVAVTGEERRPMRILSVFAIFGFIWGFLVYASPFILQAWLGRSIQWIPIPWIDLNKRVQVFFPGAILGILTDLIPYAIGLVIPFNAAVGMAAGSLAVYFFGNWLTVKYNLSPVPWWEPDMSIAVAGQRCVLYFWSTIVIGVGLAAGLAPLMHRPGILKRAFSRMLHSTKGSKERLSDAVSFGKFILLPLIATIVAGTALFVILVPHFVMANPWILPFIMLMPIVTTLVTGRMRAETGVEEFPVGNMRNIMFLATGYRTADAWLAPNPFQTGGRAWLTRFKIAELTETSSTSVVKAYLLLLPVTVVFSLVYIDLLWRMGPIPSARYPGAAAIWPIDVTYTSLWIKGGRAFPTTWILYSFLGATGIYFALTLLKVPVSFIGIGVGVGQLPPYALAYLTGGIVGKILERRFGKERWNRRKMLVSGGLAMGEGIAVTISVAVSIIINSIWNLPF